MNNRACNVNEPSSSRSAEDLGFEKGYLGEGLCCWAIALCKIEAVTVFVYFCTITYPQTILKPHPITKYDTLRTSYPSRKKMNT